MAISIGTKVQGKKGNGIIVKIITKSTGYVQVDYNGSLVNEMAFNLLDENGVSLKSKPAKAERKVLTPEEQLASKIQSAKSIYLSVNEQWNRNTTYKLACSLLDKVETKGNEFIDSLLDSFYKKNSLSEKQAYFLAKFTVETNQF